jgi:LacI family transcriptional regulator
VTTIRDIAREAGVSVSTVSRVLSGHPDVSPLTAQRVQEIIETRRYVQNRAALNLKRRDSNAVCVVVKGRTNLLFAAILEEINCAIHAAGLASSVEYVEEGQDEVAAAHVLAREVKPRGLLFLGGDLDNFRRGFAALDRPSVLVTGSAEPLGFEALSSVFTDDAAGTALALEHLVGLGHQRIGVVGGHREFSPTSRARLEACQAFMVTRGLPFELERDFAPTLYTMAGSYEATGALLQRSGDLTALFCMSDVMAVGAIRRITDNGARVPQDISVVGFDGIDLGRYVVPRLTSVDQRGLALAQRAVEVLLDRLETPSLEPVHEAVPLELAPGESVQALKPDLVTSS